MFRAVELCLGAFVLLISYGLWIGRRWAWIATIVYAYIHSIADLGFIANRSFAVDKCIGLFIFLGQLYDLLRPNVRAYFGKVGASSYAR